MKGKDSQLFSLKYSPKKSLNRRDFRYCYAKKINASSNREIDYDTTIRITREIEEPKIYLDLVLERVFLSHPMISNERILFRLSLG